MADLYKNRIKTRITDKEKQALQSRNGWDFSDESNSAKSDERKNE